MLKFPQNAPADASSHASGRLDAPGQLLADLEARQDAAMADLEALDKRLIEVLQGLGVTPEEETVEVPPQRVAA